MAWEQPGVVISLPTTSTGIAQYRFVTVNSGGNAAYPATLAQTIGITQTGTTGSTRKPTGISVMVSGVSKLALSSGSTQGAGKTVAASSKGSGWAPTPAAYVAGFIVAGSSGSAARVVSCLIAGVSGSTALA